MEQSLLPRKAWTLIGASVMALTVSFIWTRSTTVKVPSLEFEEMRDAVASPVSPAMLGGRVAQPNAGYFASPAERRAEAERALFASRPKLSKETLARASRAAKARRERAAAVTAQ